MRVQTLLDHLKRFKPHVRVTIESPMHASHCYPIQIISQAEDHGEPILILSSDEQVQAPCHRCEEKRSAGSLVYDLDYMLDGKPWRIAYDVTGAYAFAAQHQPVHTFIEPSDAEHLVLVNLSETFCGRHVDHVDRSRPALVGMHGGLLVLLDGTHRMMARLKNLEPAIAYVLSEEQLQPFVLLDGPR
jgi:hypothetical protein